MILEGLDIDVLQMYSAALPAIVGLPARPWNGHVLTTDERAMALAAARSELRQTGAQGLAAQAAHEVLSEHVL